MSSRNTAFVILFTQMKSHLSVCMRVFEKQRGDAVCWRAVRECVSVTEGVSE